MPEQIEPKKAAKKQDEPKLTVLKKGELTVESGVPAEVVRLKMQGWKVEESAKPESAKSEPAKTTK